MSEQADDEQTETGECAEGGNHWTATRRNDDGSIYRVCTECGELLDDEQD